MRTTGSRQLRFNMRLYRIPFNNLVSCETGFSVVAMIKKQVSHEDKCGTESEDGVV